MAFSLLPHWTGATIFDIDPAALARRGITLLLADLDNTLVPTACRSPRRRSGPGRRPWRGRV